MKIRKTSLRNLIRKILIEVNEYSWEISDKKKAMLDKEGMEQSDKDNVEQYLTSLGLMKKS